MHNMGSNPILPFAKLYFLLMLLVQAAKLIGAGIAVSAISGAGVGIGTVFGALINAVSRNPGLTNQLFSYAILGFALTEAIALFGLIIAFIFINS